MSPFPPKRTFFIFSELKFFICEKPFFEIYKDILMKYIFLAFIFFIPSLSLSKTVEKTLASVEEEMISLLDLKEARQRIKAGFFDDSFLIFLFNKNHLQKKDSSLLQFLIYKKLIDISAERSQISINEKHIQEEIKHKRKRRRLSKKSFSRMLVKNRFTSSSYKEFLRKSLSRKQFLQREVMEKIRISDEDLNEYAVQTQGKALFTSFEYELAYLVFPPDAKGKTQARKTFQALSKNSAYFDEWAPARPGEKKEHLKKIQLSSLHPDIKKAVQKLSTGQASEVLSLPSGHHIFKVLWKTPVITAQNQKRKKKLSVKLFQQLFNQKVKAWLEEKKTKVFIQTNL